jgi:hypothetical protein
MLRKLLEIVRTQLFLVRDVQENRDKLNQLRKEFDTLADVVVELQHQIRTVREEDRNEREKVILKIENVLLKFERQLPSTKPKDKSRFRITLNGQSCLSMRHAIENADHVKVAPGTIGGYPFPSHRLSLHPRA